MSKTVLSIVFLSFLSFSNYMLGQQSDPNAQILAEKKVQLIQQFGIYEQDHRGLVIYFSDQDQISYPIQATFNTLREALESYFYGTFRLDMVSVSVSEPQSLYPAFEGGVPIDMNQSIEKYIQLFNQ
jgi:hypothetical protein